jgi:uncharacterized protein (DUF1697 family)
MTTYIALLRGINLGARRRVSMPALRDELTDAGYGDVRTHLQSGNVVLTSDVAADRLEQDLEELVAGRLGVDTPVVVRTRDQLAAVVAGDPFGDDVDDPRRFQVSFLGEALDASTAAELVAADVAPERVAVARGGREVYAWHPEGIQRSRLAGRLDDRRLGVTATARNWNTVTALLELADRTD